MIDVLYKKIKCFSEKIISKILDYFRKNVIFGYSSFVIDGKIIVSLLGEST